MFNFTFHFFSSAELHGTFTLAFFDRVGVRLEHVDSFLPEIVAVWLREDLEVVCFQVAHEFNSSLFDDADVEVRARAQIVVDTSLDSL